MVICGRVSDGIRRVWDEKGAYDGLLAVEKTPVGDGWSG
jgi:hypothetical protein